MRLILLTFMALFLASAAPAQEAGTAADIERLSGGPITAEAAREILSRLSDREVREVLLARLDAAAEPDDGDERALDDLLRSGTANLLDSLWTSASRTVVIPGVLMRCYAVFADGRPLHLPVFLGQLALVVGAGLFLARAAKFGLRRRRARITAEPGDGLYRRLLALAHRTLLDMASVLVFFVAAQALSAAFFSHPLDRQTAAGLVTALALIGVIRYAARFLLAPRRPDLRLVTADDATARLLMRRATMIGVVGVMARWLLDWTYLTGAEPGYARLGFWLNLMMMVLLADTLWRARAGIAAMMIGDGAELTPLERRIARWWPAICAGLIVSLWLMIEAIVANAGVIEPLREGAGGLTLIIIVLAPALDNLIRGVSARFAPPPEADDPPGLTEARRLTRRGLVRVGRVLMIVVLMLILTGLWGLDLMAMSDGNRSERIITGLIEIGGIILISYGLWETVEIVHGRQKAFDDAARGAVDPDEPGGGEGGGVGGSRATTVAPLLRGTAMAAIVAVTIFSVMAELGFNITALIAGFGVIGLAIGFGAQTLIKDIVSGMFFLLDDAFRVGEYIEIGDTRGTVEKISIRSLRLRHHRGAVHTLPYGEIAKLTNYSRDWVIMKLSFRVPFDVDVDKVRKLFKQIGQKLLNDPEIGQDFMQPFKSQGVSEFDDSAMIVRGKFMTRPGKQFMARKKIYVAVQQAFRENGIPFARKEVRVHVPGLEETTALTPDAQRAVAAAAQTAAAPGPAPG